MPPRKQINEEQIVETAYNIVRKDGMDALSMRNLAKCLNCSTQPIYLAFQDMNELKNALGQKARLQMISYAKTKCVQYEDEFLAFVLGYVEFAFKEQNLYSLLFTTNQMTIDEAEQMVNSKDIFKVNMVIYANGIIVMNHFGTLQLEWEQIEKMLTDTYQVFTRTLQ